MCERKYIVYMSICVYERERIFNVCVGVMRCVRGDIRDLGISIINKNEHTDREIRSNSIDRA